MFKLKYYLKYYKKQVIIGPIFKWLEAVFELIVPLVMARIIDVGIANKDISYVIKMGGLMVLLGLVGLCFAIICQYLASIASQGIGTRMRNDLFSHINSLSHAELDKIGTTSLITRMTNDVNQMQLVVAMLIRLVVRAPFLVIGATIMAMMIDIKLSIIFLIAAPLLALVLYIVMSKSIPYFRVIQKKLDRVSLVTRENLEGARVIRAFSKQDHEKNRFDEAADDVAATSVNVGKISALLNPINFVILNTAIIAIIWFGGERVYIGDLTQGEVIAFVNYITQILLALVVVAQLVVIFTKGSASAARINEVFNLTSTLVESSTPVDNQMLDQVNPKPIIEFRNVSFAYPTTQEYSLSNLSIKIMAGETIGIIGGTGCGKSTLVNLMPRFYDASEGQILVNGIDVKDYPFKQLRKLFGIVPQKAVLFYGTIQDNMRWGNKEATDHDIKKALQTAQAYDFVCQLEEKDQTLIMQGGKNLSGGQKQRLTIARALTGDPKILILDDSASALDFATDAALRKAIQENTTQMTVIMVSQRATTIKDADKIIVLDDGQVAGIGTHKQLLKDCQVYSEICLSQLSAKEVENS